ncbi:geranylgeranylglyceryl/heptaprenylglyceryl phosphate synthase [Acidilobus sp.]|uniref:geranylgeranylglyceryl/heptaprenylglyceryl phosphate synthase n=1 Tax=Acidilobus sp. TaxID=1872109 RepID=UPI003D0427E4
MKIGKVLRMLLSERDEKGKIHLTLIDPEKTSPEEAERIAMTAADAGSTAILIGGSLGIFEPLLSEVVRAVRKSGLPVILFPGNINGLTPHADAVLFMTLMNSDDPYYVTGVQAQAAPIVLRMGIEPIPTAYIIVGYGGAAGYIGRARPIPYERSDILAAYALASAMMGASLIYLEAGSGAPQPIPPSSVRVVKSVLNSAGFDGLLIVGGGINSPEVAAAIAEAGADGIVNGTLVEKDPRSLYDMVNSLRLRSSRH